MKVDLRTFCTESPSQAGRFISRLAAHKDAVFVGLIQELTEPFVEGRQYRFHNWIVVYRASEDVSPPDEE